MSHYKTWMKAREVRNAAQAEAAVRAATAILSKVPAKAA